MSLVRRTKIRSLASNVLAAAAATLALLAAARASFAVTPAKIDDPDTTLAEPRRILWMDGVENAYPRWSNDGKRVLFQSNRDGKWQLYVMDADGKNERRISDGAHNDNFPDWSPDNRSIAFISDRDGNEDVYVMASDGTGVRSLAPHPARDLHPYWSPDGRTILFNSMRDVERFQIYSVRADGTALKRLTTSPDDQTCARLSPDGRRMVYLANLASGHDDVLTADSLARGETNVSNDAAPDGWPAWTPDGRSIVFAKSADGGATFALYSMRADGFEVRRLTRPAAGWTDARPGVSPDGKLIVFNRARGKTIGIYVLDLTPLR
jgi:TolB protein